MASMMGGKGGGKGGGNGAAEMKEMEKMWKYLDNLHETNPEVATLTQYSSSGIGSTFLAAVAQLTADYAA